MSSGDQHAKIQPILIAIDAAQNLDENFDPSVDGTPGADLAGVDNQMVGTSPEEYFQPPIIRERSSVEPDLIADEVDGDHYFAPRIVREQNLRKDVELNAMFSELQKCCPILLSDLISALDSLY